MTRTRTRGGSLWLVGLAVALLLAGVVSYYASSSPDGLEFVAEKLGFMDAAADHLAESSPLADYELAGIENERAAVGMAGIVKPGRPGPQLRPVPCSPSGVRSRTPGGRWEAAAWAAGTATPCRRHRRAEPDPHVARSPEGGRPARFRVRRGGRTGQFVAVRRVPGIAGGGDRDRRAAWVVWPGSLRSRSRSFSSPADAFIATGPKVVVLGLAVSQPGLWAAWALLAKGTLGAWLRWFR